MIVETDDVDGTTPEEVVTRVGLVAACRDGARRVVTTYNLCQMPCEKRLYGELPFLGECRGIVTCIQDQVGLFE